MLDLVADLKAPRFFGMATCYADWVEQGSASGLTTHEALLTHLVQAETTDRALRSIRYQMHIARFPIRLASTSTRRRSIVGKSIVSPRQPSPRRQKTSC